MFSEVFVERMLRISILLSFIVLSGAACSRQSAVCATDPPNLPIESRQPQIFPEGQEKITFPKEIKIRNRMIPVDRIVHGYVCDETWSGTVYVDCDIEVPDWEADEEGEARFFANCDLEVDESAVIYVAYHNDEAYYKGCSCHTNE
jgi:hypothetical protein